VWSVGQSCVVISGVTIHLANDLPVLVDLEEMPGAGDRMIRCTNVRTIDGKRPAFVHEKSSTFLLPLHIVRVIEVPKMSNSSAVATQDELDFDARHPEPDFEPELDPVDEDAEEDLLARIRQI
jgi:hypothetical protein